MAARSGPTAKLGWDDTERQEFSKALKQPLLIQTPLQVVLETLFTRIQSQATMFADLQRRIERIEARDINAEELLGRIRVCEDALAVVNHEKLSPFNQQEVLQRLEDIELRLATAKDLGSSPLSPNQATRSYELQQSLSRRASLRDLSKANTAPAGLSTQAESRLEAIEAKLAGVYNLNGKLLAVEQMAQELGLEIPDTEYSPSPEGPEDDADEGGADTPPGPGGGRGVSFVEQPGTKAQSRGVSSRGKSIVDRINNGSPPSPTNNHAGSSAGGVWPGKPELSQGGVSLQRSGSGMRMAEIISQIDELRSETDMLRELVEELQTGVAQVKGDAAKGGETLGLRVSALETASVQMRENLMQEITAVKNKDKAREGEVSFADFSALSSKVESTAAEVATATSGLAELRDQQVAPLKEQLSDLKDQFKRVHETRDMDTLFHNRISKLEGTIGDIKSEVALAVQGSLDDVARLSDLGALEEAIEQRAMASDVRQLAAQQASLAQSVSGMADWLAVRPDTADGVKGTGSSATRFKCLTCDREIRTQEGGPDVKARGTFLPKLEGLPVGPHGPMPVGPGLNAGELRRLAEERANGRKASSPMRGSELDDYGADTTRSKGGSPGRSRGSGRIPVPMPSSSIMPKSAPGTHRTPVFI